MHEPKNDWKQMKLIDEIIELASNDNAPLSGVLRKFLVLAHQLKNQRLKEWISNELNGYPLVLGREGSGIRRRPHRDYLIFYRVDAAASVIEVLHVLNGAQDYDAILFPQD